MSDYLQPAEEPKKDDGAESDETCAARWADEMAAAKKKLHGYHDEGEKADRRFRGKKKVGDNQDEADRRLNLYSASVQQMEAMLYAQTPTVDVQRRFADSNDAMARVSSELLGRVLNEDLHYHGEDQQLAFRQALHDRLVPGMGNVRVRYEATVEDEPLMDEAGQPVVGEDGKPAMQPVLRDECVETIYVHWKDQLWDPLARVFSECRWWGFRVYMTRKQLRKRFGAEVAAQVPMNARRSEDGTQEKTGPLAQAEVWEIWDKERGEVCWVSDGVPTTLDRKPPPVELEGFWPFPRPMAANLGTDEFVPVSDFKLAKDLYDALDELATRRKGLIDALKVRGLYDSSMGDIERVFEEGASNQLIPVKGPAWATLMEKGGINAAIVWVPLEQVVAALQEINSQIEILVAEIYQVTGWSDVMRGQQVENGTPGEAQVKAHFASARLNAIAEDFARFCADVQRLRAEIMAKLFSPETIIERSNAKYTYDEAVAMQAVQLIRQDVRGYRIEIKAESLAMADYGERRMEATEVLSAIGGFVQQAGQVAQAVPGSMPFLLELLRWSVARVKGGQEIGGLLDKAIQAAQQQAQQPQAAQQPDPKLQADQMKHQNQMQALQAKTQADLVHMQAETQQMALRQRDQAAVNIAEEKAKAAIKHGQAVASAQIQGVMP